MNDTGNTKLPQNSQRPAENTKMSENDISYIIRGAIFKIYTHLGPGLLESVYVSTLEYQLKKAGLNVGREVPLSVVYGEINLDLGFRMDLLINDLVIIEVKSVENLAEVHHKQLLTYLKLSGKKLGILINFNCADIEKGIFRKVNGL
jgi:GxxExxY protein